jgi:serine/threonine protein kinase
VLSPSGTELKRSQYRLLGLVGQGQFGRVYCAAHRKTGRLVALKNLEQQRFSTHKFLRELRFLLTLQHRNIVTCMALEHTLTGRYLVMDYCAGGTLRNLMAEDVQLRKSQRFKLVVDILAGLAHAHSKGIVHCDIKPENILLDLQPEGWVARISDFGVARLSQELSSHFSGNTGSPAYMAPERFYGQYSVASDIYAVGVLLFELLVGYRPFAGTPGELMSAHLNAPVVVPSEIPDDCKTVIKTALEKLSARRYASAQDMRAALLPFTEDQYWQAGRQGGAAAKEPLLNPLSAFPIQDLSWEQRRAIATPISSLSAYREVPTSLTLSVHPPSPARMGRILGTRVEEWAIAPLVSQEGKESEHRTMLPQPVQQVWLCPQVSVAMTHRDLYFWSVTNPHPPKLLASFQQPFLATVERQGRWLAIATLPSALNEGEVRFLPLPQASSSGYLTSTPIALSKAGQGYLPTQMIALDGNHLVLISRMMPKTVPMTNSQAPRERSGTRMEVLTRRGDRVGSLLLPVLTRSLITTPKPLQLLGIDEQNPDCLLVIDLKPYRITRYGLGVAATAIAATRWGMVAASRDGTLVFLNSHGEVLGKRRVPELITAIAMGDDYQLWVATWRGDQGNLYQANVKDLDLDMLF